MAKQRKRRILAVEDNPALAEIMRTFLESEGFEVIEANNGAVAVKLAQQEHPDLILMDLQLPQMSGLEATRRIRAINEIASVPIVAVTGFATEFDEVRARATGCNAYISKPYKMDHVLKTIAGLIK